MMKRCNNIILSTRESEILVLISKGFTNTEIGSKLFISDETVKTYRKRLLVKFNAKNSANLITKAFHANMI